MTCEHVNHTNTDLVTGVRILHREGKSTCRDCGHTWTEHSIAMSDEEYDTLLAYVAFRLDSNK